MSNSGSDENSQQARIITLGGEFHQLLFFFRTGAMDKVWQRIQELAEGSGDAKNLSLAQKLLEPYSQVNYVCLFCVLFCVLFCLFVCLLACLFVFFVNK